ncbi:hypothetical protein O181_070343 [Austropuccinia psidii MF-1]|uniref:Retrotransposon gag domain-containing protein n=1 Tax=Austropuccinia psidii MF-1 TaxID=1389203 RepID=A0A9Q3EYX7_9BASI|nr:hypothetical protein [Austropuccinia psidii MF-1]
MKAPDSFSGTQSHKLRGLIQSCQFMFHNNPENFFSDRNNILYSDYFLTGRAGKWIELYLSNIFNEDPSYLLNNWKFFETQLFTLFGDFNKVQKAEQELDNLRMKNSGHLSLYKVPLEEEGKGWSSRKEAPVTGLNPSRPPQDSSSKMPHHKKIKKGRNFQFSKDKPQDDLLNKDNKLIGSERRGGLKKAYALIVVESTKSKNDSRGLRIGQDDQEASLASRENPE